MVLEVFILDCVRNYSVTKWGGHRVVALLVWSCVLVVIAQNSVP